MYEEYDIGKLAEINKKTLEKIDEDDTITIGGGVTDCNNNVSQSSISLRELIIYSNISDVIKQRMQNILNQYGMMFEGEEERLYNTKEDIKVLLGEKYAQQLDLYQSDMLDIFKDRKEIIIMERIIELLLIKYYRPYDIPKYQYDDIVYTHRKSNNEMYDEFEYHQKCLRNPNMRWDDFSANKYDIVVTYKDIKQLIFEARDSGGNMDVFGYAHDGTTGNCVDCFVAEKLGLETNQYGYFDNDEEERDKICEDIYEIVTSHMKDFRIEIY